MPQKFPNTLSGRIDHALYQVCVGSGFCTNLSGISLLKKYGEGITSADFASSVLYSEGMAGKYSEHWDYLEKAFVNFVEEGPPSHRAFIIA